MLPVLGSLLSEKWHHSHEDLVTLVGELHDASSVDVLYGATRWVPDYLAFDDSRALAAKLPPLRQRPEDIPLLVNYFVDMYNQEFRKKIQRVSPEAMSRSATSR